MLGIGHTIFSIAQCTFYEHGSSLMSRNIHIFHTIAIQKYSLANEGRKDRFQIEWGWPTNPLFYGRCTMGQFECYATVVFLSLA